VRSAISSAIVLILGPFGCPESEPNEPEIEEPVAPARPEVTADPTAKPRGPQELTADVAQSKVNFAVARATIGHIGHFDDFAATLELVDGQPRELEITVETGSVVADREGLTSHLKSADFFDVDQFPSASFSTDTIAAITGEDANTYAITGTMNLHGVRGKLEFPATIEIEPNRVVATATLDISAKAFGISYAGMEAELAEDKVALEVELVFPR
jgi:polyisoprenoid-binding protein YceI